MATIELNGETKEVKDGESIIEACEELGVPFGCQNGLCGSCRVTIKEGGENLSEPTEQEQTLGIDHEKGERLACQCKIKSGTVKISPF